MHTKVVNMATIGGNQPVNRLEIFIQLYIDRTCMILHRKRLALPPSVLYSFDFAPDVNWTCDAKLNIV